MRVGGHLFEGCFLSRRQLRQGMRDEPIGSANVDLCTGLVLRKPHSGCSLLNLLIIELEPVLQGKMSRVSMRTTDWWSHLLQPTWL